MAGTEVIFQGVSISAYSQNGYEGNGYANLLSRAVDLGANSIGLGSVSIIDLSTGEVREWISAEGYNRTASAASVEEAIADVEAKGLDVFLKPQIHALNPESYQYTGSDYSNLTDWNLALTDPAAFFAGYQTYILKWAKLAEQYHIPLLSIGNEMLAATKPEYTAYWDDIIASVRVLYGGKLTYAALTDVQYPLNSEVLQIQFWDKLDYVGVDMYPDFPTGTITPTVAQLDSVWVTQGWKRYLADVAASTGKQIVFTETGSPSFVGAANRSIYTDALIGKADTQTDMVTQANWYQSFINTWTGSMKPDWLIGTFFWNNDPPEFPGLYDVTGYTIFDKPAAIVVTAFFDTINSLAVAQNSFTGSAGNDRIKLYGNAGQAKRTDAVHDSTVIRAQTFTSTVTIHLNGSIINDVTPTVHFFINGIDVGTRVLSSVPSNYVDPGGIVSSDVVPFTFLVDNLVIDEIKVAIDSDVIPTSQVYIDHVEVNGCSLVGANVIYEPLSGTVSSYLLPDGSMPDGGSVLIDTVFYKNTLANTPGTVANPITVNGAGGIDRVYVLGRQDQYIISAEKSGVVTLAESSGLDQNALLSGISVIEFADGTTFIPPTDIYTEPSISGGIAALAGVGGLGLLAWVLF